MRKVQFLWAILGTFIPAVLNFSSILIAAGTPDKNFVGMAFTLLAGLYIAIDIGNFGTTRMVLIPGVRENIPIIRRLDLLSALISAIAFSLIYILLNITKIIDMEINLILILLPPIFYSLSHSSIGILRVTEKNLITATIQVTCALLRITISILLFLHEISSKNFIIGLLIIEGIYGILFYFASYRKLPKVNEPPSLEFLPLITSSWGSNILQTITKHIDLVLISAIAGPATSALYRPLKSVANIAHNLSYTLSLVFFSSEKKAADKLLTKKNIFLTLTAVPLISITSYLIATYATKILPRLLNSETLTGLVFFGTLTCSLTFINRFLQTYLFRRQKLRFFTTTSALESGLTLSLLAILTGKYLIYGAAISLSLASLMTSIFLFILVKNIEKEGGL
ncbi:MULTISPECIES: hypothetical protein [unclassified Pseudomonas]|uniref:hypothetical protein n=1 Tax=unclassified Pseudomonas TaxID=196821 RepID=UPI000AFE7A55|nr:MULTISPECIES: hypothetical protein [unclassified Pseudomonas]QOF86329.1 hypothetical protein IG194_06510 [Pseudomonas sp. ADPe]